MRTHTDITMFTLDTDTAQLHKTTDTTQQTLLTQTHVRTHIDTTMFTLDTDTTQLHKTT